MKTNLQPEPGTYILVLKVKTSQNIKTGKIGKYTVKKGYYIYVGSAHGPGGIKARVTRHLKKIKPKHWHIDYLREAGSVIAVLINYSDKKKESIWASNLSHFAFLSMPIEGFGSSDCSCPSHLFFCTDAFNIDVLNDIDKEPLELLKIL